MAKRKLFSWRRIRNRLELIGDRIKLAMLGSSYCLSRKKYLISFIICSFGFLYFLTFFQDGNSNLHLLFSKIDAEQKIDILGRVFLNSLHNFLNLYGLSLVLLSILQGLAVTLMVYTWRHKEKDEVITTASTSTIASALGFVALGCPSCGISLLTPILSAIAGASASLLAERVNVALTLIAYALLLYSICKLGYLIFVIITAAKYKEKHGSKPQKNN